MDFTEYDYTEHHRRCTCMECKYFRDLSAWERSPDFMEEGDVAS